MLRGLAVVGLIVALLAALVFVPRLLRTAEHQGADQMGPECNLRDGPCTWSRAGHQWQTELTPLVEKASGATEYRLTVTGEEAPEHLLAVLRGESMYMGEYPVPLVREQGQRFTARFTAPLCSTGSDMIWRIDLQNGQEPLERTPPKMVFQARSL